MNNLFAACQDKTIACTALNCRLFAEILFHEEIIWLKC